jgi:CheY-like chemotaxis protein
MIVEPIAVLIAEDNPIIRQMIKRKLLKMHYQVFVAEDGEEAVEAFKAHADSIDVVLMGTVLGALCVNAHQR